MKKIFVAVVLCVLFVFVVSSAFAASRRASNSGRAHKNVGCGLGTLLWQDRADDSVLSQSLQATTNGTSGNQTFGITTGTSDCDQPANFASNDRLNEFVVANMDNLAKDIARGNGETLETFAELMQVPTEKRAEFYHNLQTNFAKVFSSEHVVLASVVDNAAAVAPKN
jgi:hypothetical protein